MRKWVWSGTAVLLLAAALAGAPTAARAYKQWKLSRRQAYIQAAKERIASGDEEFRVDWSRIVDADEPIAKRNLNEPDDPEVRRLASLQVFGRRTPEYKRMLVDLATKEVAKAKAHPARNGAATTVSSPGNAPWYNIGPATARSEYNGSYYKALDTGRPTGIVADPTNAATVYVAASEGGIWRTNNFGNGYPTWTPLLDGLGFMSVGSLAIDPNTPTTLYAGMGDLIENDGNFPGGFVISSTDGGDNWGVTFLMTGKHPVDGKPSFSQFVQDIRVDPTNSNRIFAGADDGLYISNDGGTTYQIVGLPTGPAGALTDKTLIWSIAYLGPAPLGKSAWLVAGWYASSGLGDLWRSVDSGATWSSARQSGLLPATVVGTGTPAAPAASDISRIALAAVPRGANSAIIYAECASIDGGSTNALLKSSDGGNSWKQLANASTPVTNPTKPIPDGNGGMVSQCPTTDVGHGQSTYNLAVAVDPSNPNRAIFGGNLCAIRTVDGGATFDNISHWLPQDGSGATVDGGGNVVGFLPYVHADWHVALAYRQVIPCLASPIGNAPCGSVGPLNMLVGTDGGLFVSKDLFDNTPTTINWQQPDVGLITHQPYSHGSGDPVYGNQQVVFAGLQDNGTRWRQVADQTYAGTFDGKVWDQLIGGDGIGAAVSSDQRGQNPIYWASVEFGRYFCRPRAHDCSVASHLENGAEIPNWIFAPNPDVGDPQQDEPFGIQYAPVFDDQSSVLSMSNTIVYKISVDGFDNSTYQAITPASGIVAPPGSTSVRGIQGVPAASPFNYVIDGVPAHIYDIPLTGGNVAHIIDKGANGGISIITPLKGITVTVGGKTYSERGTYVAATPPNPAALGGTDIKMTWVLATTATAATDGTPIPNVDGLGNLFMTADGGATWKPLSGTGDFALPPVPIYSVKFDPGDPTGHTLWVGCEFGVYRTTDLGVSWALVGGPTPGSPGGQPFARAFQVTVSRNGSLVRLSSYGRGIWEIYPRTDPPTGAGNGDFDRNGVIDFLDLAALASRMGQTPIAAPAPATAAVSSVGPNPAFAGGYDQSVDLAGGGTIDESGLQALLSKFGSTP